MMLLSYVLGLFLGMWFFLLQHIGAIVLGLIFVALAVDMYRRGAQHAGRARRAIRMWRDRRGAR